MEGAVRVFAGEFCQSTLVIPSADPGTPAAVVTPSGALCRRMYIAGALTELVETGDMLRCRIADPTGAFDVIAGGRNAVFARSLRKIPVPSFVTITGYAQRYQKNGKAVLSVRPEDIQAVDRACRDQILLVTAEYTLQRLEHLQGALEKTSTDDRVLQVIRHYAFSPAKILELVHLVEGVVQNIRPQEPQPPAGQTEVRAVVIDLMKDRAGPRGIAVEEIMETLAVRGIRKEEVLAALESLIVDDECYQPQKGYVKLL